MLTGFTRKRKQLTPLSFFTSILILFSFHSYAAPKSDLWAYWNQANQANTQTISHQAWQNLLDKYLIKQGKDTLFRYSKVTPADKSVLNAYVQSLTSLDPRQYNKKEQFAYWVNLYNAHTVQLILENYPLKSITKLGGLLSYGPWDEKSLTITGQKLSLNDIEHRVLRPIWQDYRIHYAVNCASLGCPNLQQKAFSAKNSAGLLAQAEIEFIHSNKGARVTPEGVIVSSIFDWYAADFGGKFGAGSKAKAWQYLQSKRNDLKAIPTKPEYDYNWALNDAK